MREIERREYDAAQFIDELKQQVHGIVHQVMTDPTNRRITVVDEQEEKKKKTAKSGVKKGTAKKGASAPVSAPAPTPAAPTSSTAPHADDSIIGTVCPKCGKGIIIKGRTAYGCSDYKNCDYRVNFG